MSGIDPLVVGGFYRCTSPDGHDPVRIWVGRIDSEDDLGGKAIEPVVSLIVKSVEDDMPTINHAPFGLDAVLDGQPEEAEPFDLEDIRFAESYAVWRKAWDEDEAGAWAISPAEAYAGMLAAMLGGMRK